MIAPTVELKAEMSPAEWVEFLESEIAVAAMSAEADAIDADVEFNLINFEAGYVTGYRAAQPQWIDISEIPDEWKDGRDLIAVINEDEAIVRTVYYCAVQKSFVIHFENDTLVEAFITHAMLPPPMPIEPAPKGVEG